jgi:hypothetical protein
LKAFLNCSGCSTHGWVDVNEEQMAVCKVCKKEVPINASIITAIKND